MLRQLTKQAQALQALLAFQPAASNNPPLSQAHSRRSTLIRLTVVGRVRLSLAWLQLKDPHIKHVFLAMFSEHPKSLKISAYRE
jgi:hypothetical protein